MLDILIEGVLNILINKEVDIITQGEVIKILKKAGWLDTGRGKGSHKVFFDPVSKRTTTVPKKEKDLPKGTLNVIRKQTGINEIK